MDAARRSQNQFYFSRGWRGSAHALIAKIRTHPLVAPQILRRPDAVYDEALALTAAALADWRPLTSLGTPICFSDIDHLDRLGLLPDAMRPEPLGFKANDTPVTAEYFQKVLLKLQEQARHSGSPQDARIAAYHEALLAHSAFSSAPAQCEQLDKMLVARLWDTRMREEIFDGVRLLHRIGLRDAYGDVQSLMDFVQDKIA